MLLVLPTGLSTSRISPPHEYPLHRQICVRNPSAALLEARGLHKRYGGVHALKGVDIQIERGKFYHLLGENGCGKSTLIKILSGTQSPSEGEVVIDGLPQPSLDPIAALRAGIETVYQDLSLLPNLSVEENIGLTARLVASGGRLAVPTQRGRMRAMAAEATQSVGLPSDPEFLCTTVDQLPIATRQLVAISRAIASKASLVIMDEPTTALTRKEVSHLITVIRRMQVTGTALLFVTHKLEEAREIGGKGIIMRDGAFVAEVDMTEADLDQIGELMTNRRLGQARYRSAAPMSSETPRLSVSGLTRPGQYHDLSFDLARGEILGITGLLDSGRNALALSLAGLAPPRQARCGSMARGSIFLVQGPDWLRGLPMFLRIGSKRAYSWISPLPTTLPCLCLTDLSLCSGSSAWIALRLWPEKRLTILRSSPRMSRHLSALCLAATSNGF